MKVLISIPDSIHAELKEEAWLNHTSLVRYINDILQKRIKLITRREFMPRNEITEKMPKEINKRVKDESLAVILPKGTKFVRSTYPSLISDSPTDPKNMSTMSDPIGMPTSEEPNQGHCQIPNGICKSYGIKYAIEYFDSEGLVKKEVYLCDIHSKKIKETAESVNPI